MDKKKTTVPLNLKDIELLYHRFEKGKRSNAINTCISSLFSYDDDTQREIWEVIKYAELYAKEKSDSYWGENKKIYTIYLDIAKRLEALSQILKI